MHPTHACTTGRKRQTNFNHVDKSARRRLPRAANVDHQAPDAISATLPEPLPLPCIIRTPARLPLPVDRPPHLDSRHKHFPTQQPTIGCFIKHTPTTPHHSSSATCALPCFLESPTHLSCPTTVYPTTRISPLWTWTTRISSGRPAQHSGRRLTQLTASTQIHRDVYARTPLPLLSRWRATMHTTRLL